MARRCALLWIIVFASAHLGGTAVVDLWSPKDSMYASSSSGGASNGAAHDNKLSSAASSAASMPSFDKSAPLNVTVQYGAHAHLVCRVLDVANKSVSWIRKKDGHLLTVDTDTFIGDGRYQVHHPAHSDTWTLHLRGVRGSDAGKYECQVSSEPKMSLVYQLNVVIPQVEIRGAPDIYVMSGSGVTLHCVISGLIDTPPYIFWYHKTERIAGSALEENGHHPAGHGHADGGKDAAAWSFSAPSGATKNGWSARVTRLGPDSLMAVLHVPPATPDFAGNYSCGPPSLQLASVMLHVLNGEQPAAMQHGKNGGGQSSSGSGIVRAPWWSVAFVTLLAMSATPLVIEAATATTAAAAATSSNELANDATPGGIISSRPETAHPAGRVRHADHHTLVKRPEPDGSGARQEFQRTRCRSTIRFTDSS